MDLKLRLLLFLPLLAVALVSFVIVRSQQGAGATLAARQRIVEALTPAALDALVRLAPETNGGPGGRSATCIPRGSGELHNPWSCRIRYPDGRLVQYQVTVNANGSFAGNDQVVFYRGQTTRSSGTISGCCTAVP